MAGNWNDYLANEILDHGFGAASFSAPATVYFALYTSAPTDSGGGTEVSGGSYARVAVTNNATNFPAASSRAKSNGAAITFPTATGSWSTVVAMAGLDASSGGNFLFWADLTVSKTINTNDTPSFAIGDFDVTIAAS